MEYARRTIDDELDVLLPLASAIAIDGAKGVGKTQTASQRAHARWLLDVDEQRQLIKADPDFNDAPAGTLLLDEWQYLPSVWNTVRRHVDAGAPPGRFLLTGSATPRSEADTHTGAGRILSLRMRPMAFHERGLEHPTVSLRALLAGAADIRGVTGVTLGIYLNEIVASGFPGIRCAHERLRRPLLDAYLQRIVDRELPDLGFSVRQPESLRAWLVAYAAATSTPTSQAKIIRAATGADGLPPAKTTTITYRDYLTQLWLLDPVPAWGGASRALNRVAQAPKHHLADPALAARLLGLSASALASDRGAAMAGPLFESLATLGVRVAAQSAEARVGHLRTSDGGNEIDLVVEGPENELVGIEVKLSASVDDADVRHLHWFRERYRGEVADLVVLTTGARAYRREDGIAVVPLALLGA